MQKAAAETYGERDGCDRREPCQRTPGAHPSSVTALSCHTRVPAKRCSGDGAAPLPQPRFPAASSSRCPRHRAAPGPQPLGDLTPAGHRGCGHAGRSADSQHRRHRYDHLHRRESLSRAPRPQQQQRRSLGCAREQPDHGHPARRARAAARPPALPRPGELTRRVQKLVLQLSDYMETR